MASNLQNESVHTIDLTLHREHEALPPKKRKVSIESYLLNGTPDGIISASFVLAGLHSPEKSSKTPVVAPHQNASSSEMKSKAQKVAAAQIRYDPGVPMTAQEKAVWRREQRRMRNRESAAASRKKTRDRISGLEDELKIWKEKYNHALVRLEVLEDKGSSPFTPILPKFDHRIEKNVVSPPTLPTCAPSTIVEELSLPPTEAPIVTTVGRNWSF
mmetsp:Transcript_6080/g.6290  ORF Transcript_6080/g.6290 Transcript_6080/m.6290 type:complete len:215 (-) Transcript_6080:359-1003(-)